MNFRKYQKDKETHIINIQRAVGIFTPPTSKRSEKAADFFWIGFNFICDCSGSNRIFSASVIQCFVYGIWTQRY